MWSFIHSRETLNSSTPNLSGGLNELADRGHKVAQYFVETADMFATSFAGLDKNLAEGKSQE